MTKRQWRLVLGGYVVMAAGFVVFGFILQHQVNRIDKNQTAIRAVERTGAVIAVHNAGATCTVALKPSFAQQRKLIESFLELNVPITRFFPRQCVAVARRAARDIFGNRPLPPRLESELGGHP